MASCENTYGPNYKKKTDDNGMQHGCPPMLASQYNISCPENSLDCQVWELTKSPDSCFVDAVVQESMRIASADLNVHKLLGVHEQGKLIDVTGKGRSISSGFQPGFPADNAFDEFITEWRSLQRGEDVVKSSYIGYDFGTIKTIDGSRDRYAIPAAVRKHITAISLKQGCSEGNRVTKLRIERSEDGNKWYGAGIITLPNDDCLNTFFFSGSVQARYWRLRPVEFAGGNLDFWSIQALEMFHDYEATNEGNIQDKIFLENRDREYSKETFAIKAYYDLVETNTELTKFGIELPGQVFSFDISFSMCISVLGRPMIIGDILEVPSEAQFSKDLKRVKKYLEVTDVAWSTYGYTHTWTPTLLKVSAAPAYASQETQDIFGDLAEYADLTGLFDKNDGNNTIWQDYNDATQAIEAYSKNQTPERGADGSHVVREFEQSEIEAAEESGYPHLTKLGLNRKYTYIEDGLPPNNAPYTEGDAFPANPKNGDYHRLTYSTLNEFYPPRLHRWSSVKNRWIWLETDRRLKYNNAKPRLTEFLEDDRSVPSDNISK